MTGLILGRLWQAAVVLGVMSVAVYALIGLMPGDPIDLMVSADPDLTPEDARRLKALYGLDRPVLERWWAWVGNVARGDLGYSRLYAAPVLDVLGPRPREHSHPPRHKLCPRPHHRPPGRNPGGHEAVLLVRPPHQLHRARGGLGSGVLVRPRPHRRLRGGARGAAGRRDRGGRRPRRLQPAGLPRAAGGDPRLRIPGRPRPLHARGGHRGARAAPHPNRVRQGGGDRPGGGRARAPQRDDPGHHRDRARHGHARIGGARRRGRSSHGRGRGSSSTTPSWATISTSRSPPCSWPPG